MLACRQHTQSRHERCGQPKDRAWHPDNDGWYEADPGDVGPIVCWACTALDRATNPQAPEHVVHTVRYVRDEHIRPLPPIEVPADRSKRRRRSP